MPQDASTYAHNVDWVFYFIYWSSAIAFILIMAAMVIMVVRYRRRPGHEAQPSPAHSTAMEMTWTLVPSVVFVMIFYWGFQGFMNMSHAPDNAYEIHVNAVQWNWNFVYPNGVSTNELHVPVNRPIRLILQSNDVIHSIFVPAFRMKKDIVPGRYNTIWFQATKTGDFPLYCAEYCGTGHSVMRSKAVVHTTGSFKQWLVEASEWVTKMPPAEAGKKLYTDKGCVQCHSFDGSARVGPSFKDIFRKSGRVLKSGKTLVADANYIHNSIINPQADIVAGYDAVMPRLNVTDQEITAIIEWMKTLSVDAPPVMEAWPAEAVKGQAAAAASQPDASNPVDKAATHIQGEKSMSGAGVDNPSTPANTEKGQHPADQSPAVQTPPSQINSTKTDKP
jgi:cytochrome c oxidase subunit 2